MLRQFRRRSIAARLHQRLNDEKLTEPWKNKRYISGVAKRKRESLSNHESTRKNVNFYQNFQILRTLKTSLFDKSFNFDTPLSQCLSLEHKSNLETGHKEQIKRWLPRHLNVQLHRG